MSTRIFILADHASMRDTLVGFAAALPGAEVCGSAANAENALVKLAEALADLVLVDISPPGTSSQDFMREIRQRWPRLLSLVLTGHDEAAYMFPAFSLGAQGYLSKDNAGRLREAIDSVLQGKKYPLAGERKASIKLTAGKAAR